MPSHEELKDFLVQTIHDSDQEKAWLVFRHIFDGGLRAAEQKQTAIFHESELFKQLLLDPNRYSRCFLVSRGLPAVRTFYEKWLGTADNRSRVQQVLDGSNVIHLETKRGA